MLTVKQWNEKPKWWKYQGILVSLERREFCERGTVILVVVGCVCGVLEAFKCRMCHTPGPTWGWLIPNCANLLLDTKLAGPLYLDRS